MQVIFVATVIDVAPVRSRLEGVGGALDSLPALIHVVDRRTKKRLIGAEIGDGYEVVNGLEGFELGRICSAGHLVVL